MFVNTKNQVFSDNIFQAILRLHKIAAEYLNKKIFPKFFAALQ